MHFGNFRTSDWPSTLVESLEADDMTKQPNRHFGVPLNRPRGLLLLSLMCGVAAAQGDSPAQLRRFIDHQAGGIRKLMVPARDIDLPQPRLANGSPDPRFETTEAKRYLGKMLFFDPVRTARILPQFGGVL